MSSFITCNWLMGANSLLARLSPLRADGSPNSPPTPSIRILYSKGSARPQSHLGTSSLSSAHSCCTRAAFSGMLATLSE